MGTGVFSRTCWLGGASLLLLASSAGSQQSAFPLYDQARPVVSINRENLIQQSNYGRDLVGRLAVQQKELIAENDQLAAQLEREERELTGLRKTLAPQEFTPLAEAFDAKVNRVRADQDRKGVALAKALESARFGFFRQAEAVIGKMMAEEGILFVLDEGAVWLSNGGDATQAVIERMNAAYAAGEITLE